MKARTIAVLLLSEREEENMNGDMWRNLSAS